MKNIIVYIPKKDVETVKQAMFDAGAGRYDGYDHCCWQVEGQGQFRPLEGASPHLGDIGEITYEKEFRVEMICAQEHIENVIAAMKAAHPYEVPAYSVLQLEKY